MDLLRALGEGLDNERIILCGFRGDPKAVDKALWRPVAWDGGAIGFEPEDNVYATVSGFRRAPDGSWRRRGELFGAGRALMVDDVGTKVPREVVAGRVPTYIVETSEGNEQWWYILAEPERDSVRLDALIRAFIAGPLEGRDPGMSGVTRVGRLPGFTNGKPSAKGWRTRLLDGGDASLRWSIEDLLLAFDMKLHGRREPLPYRAIPPDGPDRLAAFNDIRRFLYRSKMIKRIEPDAAGWTNVLCPWADGHSDGDPRGAAIREPSPENQWYGAFRCHHGHCAGRGWRELTEYVGEIVAERLEMRNSQ